MNERRRFPPWLRKRVPLGGRTQGVRELLADLRLHTVCQSAHCPNECECFSRGTATFMILGNTCTRDCRFCAVRGGEPDPVDPDEPAHVAEAARRLGLRYVVVTSVTRDDLIDGGAEHFADTVRAVRDATDAQTEVLTPDFLGDAAAVDTVLDAEPTVYNHNIETVPRLYEAVRPQADYRRSLGLLEQVARSGRSVPKSGLMVGLGETDDEIGATMTDLVEAGCRMLTIGQYLAPSSDHLPVARFVEPERFEAFREEGLRRGLDWVVSGPFVRSSYCAEAAFESAPLSAVQGAPAT
jgi:lipoic acid synthetase